MTTHLSSLKTQLTSKDQCQCTPIGNCLLIYLQPSQLIQHYGQQAQFMEFTMIQFIIKALTEKFQLIIRFLNVEDKNEYNFDQSDCNIRNKKKYWQNKQLLKNNVKLWIYGQPRAFIGITLDSPANMEHLRNLFYRGKKICKLIMETIITEINKSNKEQIEYLNSIVYPERFKSIPQSQKMKRFSSLQQSIRKENKQIQNYDVQNKTYKINDLSQFNRVIRYNIQKTQLKGPNKNSFVVQRYKITEGIQVSRTVHNYSDLIRTEQPIFTSTDLVVVRIPTVEQIVSIFNISPEDQNEKQKRLQYFKVKMEKAISAIIQTKEYGKKKPNIYLLPRASKGSLDYDPKADLFTMDYCGLTIDKKENESLCENFIQNLKDCHSLLLTILDIQNHNIIHTDIKTNNAICLNKQINDKLQAKITLLIDLESSRKLVEQIIMPDVQITTQINQQNQQNLIRLWNVISKTMCSQGRVQHKKLQYISQKIVITIKELLSKTTQMYLPECLKEVEKECIRFLQYRKNKQNYKFTITAQHVNTLIGWRYDFCSFMKIIELFIIRRYPKYAQKMFSRKCRVAYELIAKLEDNVSESISNEKKQVMSNTAIVLNLLCKILATSTV